MINFESIQKKANTKAQDIKKIKTNQSKTTAELLKQQTGLTTSTGQKLTLGDLAKTPEQKKAILAQLKGKQKKAVSRAQKLKEFKTMQSQNAEKTFQKQIKIKTQKRKTSNQTKEKK